MSSTPGTSDAEALLAQRAWVRKVARALVVDEHVADEIEQDLWVGTLSRPPRIRESARGWMATALRNLLSNRRRADVRRERHEHGAATRSLALRSQAESPAEVVANAEVHQRVVDAVMNLPEPYRSAVLLRYYEGLPPAEVAARLEVPVETARTRVKRGIARLRHSFDKAEGGDRRAWCVALLPLAREAGSEAVSLGSSTATVHAGVAAGAVIMTSKVVAGVVVLVAGGAAGWIAASVQESTRDVAPGGPVVERRATDQEAEAPRLLGRGVTPDGNAEAIAELQRTVARLQEAIATGDGAIARDPEEHKAEVLERLKAIEHGEQQTALAETVRDLAAIGDAAVPDLVAMLKSGFERDWGGGFSTGGGGNAVKSYGRMRMVIIDALRQIGTEAAKDGLLSAVRGSNDLADYRDLLLLYGSTTDPTMREGISALIPGLLDKIAEVGILPAEEQASMINTLVVRWMRENRMAHLADAVARLAATSPRDDYQAREFFGLVVEFDPERAIRLVREQYPDGMEGVSGSHLMGFLDRGQVPLAQTARFIDLLFSGFDLTDQQRGSLYLSIRPILCRGIEDLGERAEDAKALLTFLEGRQGVEGDERSKGYLERAITSLRKAMEKIEGSR